MHIRYLDTPTPATTLPWGNEGTYQKGIFMSSCLYQLPKNIDRRRPAEIPFDPAGIRSVRTKSGFPGSRATALMALSEGALLPQSGPDMVYVQVAGSFLTISRMGLRLLPVHFATTYAYRMPHRYLDKAPERGHFTSCGFVDEHGASEDQTVCKPEDLGKAFCLLVTLTFHVLL